jgi:hypothetical protein
MMKLFTRNIAMLVCGTLLCIAAASAQDTLRVAPKTNTTDTVKPPPKKYRIIKRDPGIFQPVGEPNKRPVETPRDSVGRKED